MKELLFIIIAIVPFIIWLFWDKKVRIPEWPIPDPTAKLMSPTIQCGKCGTEDRKWVGPLYGKDVDDAGVLCGQWFTWRCGMCNNKYRTPIVGMPYMYLPNYDPYMCGVD